MSAPILWIGLPILLSIYLWFTRANERNTLFTGLGATLFFIFTSSLVPVGKPLLTIGDLTIQIFPSQNLLGRSFTLGEGDLLIVSLMFIIQFIFFSMSFVIDIPIRVVPIGFMLTSLFLASLSVQPFLYAALIIEVCVLLSVVLLSRFGELPANGVVRFLVFQTMAMPFMLASGWVLSAVEANPTEAQLVIQALTLLGLGFSFWLGVFPFNSWIPQLAAEKPAFLVGFILLLFNSVTLILVIRYLDGFVWLRDDARIFVVLRLLGIIIIFSSVLQFLIEKNIYRTTAFLVSYETGLALIAMSLNQAAGWNSFVLMFIPRILSIALWVVLLTYTQQVISQNETGEEQPMDVLLFTGFALAALSIAGLPFLPGFVSRLSIYSVLMKVDYPALIWVSIAGIGFVIACAGFLKNIYDRYGLGVNLTMTKTEKGYFIFLYTLILVAGIFPQNILSGFLSMLQAFPNLR